MFCVSVSLMRQGMAEEGLGEDMYEAFKSGEEIPQADIGITDDDPPAVRRMKKLIVEMTAYEPNDRPTIQQVLAVVAELNAEVRHTCREPLKQLKLATEGSAHIIVTSSIINAIYRSQNSVTQMLASVERRE